MNERDPAAVVVVTGASGWLGRPLVAALDAAGRQLRCLVPNAADEAVVKRDAPHAEIVVADVRDPVGVDRLFAGLREPAVIHTAGVIHPEDGRTRAFFDVNVGGTALVLDRARRQRAVRLVHVSSNSPFGFSRSASSVFDEDAPYDPHLGYGRSKMEAEQLVFASHERGDVETVVVRAPWFYGPYQPARQSRFFAAVRRGRFPLCGDCTNRRSMVYTGNLVDGLLRAERVTKAAGRAYWVADERPYEMTEILATVKDALAEAGLAVSPRQLRLPGATSELALLADRLTQGIGRYVQPVHVLSEMNKTIACSIDRAKAELGYVPDVALAEGMRRSVRWCLAEGMVL